LVGVRAQGLGFRVQGSGFRVQGSGFRVQGSGFRVQGLESWGHVPFSFFSLKKCAIFCLSILVSSRLGSGFGLRLGLVRVMG
jgi:hypothetical protein